MSEGLLRQCAENLLNATCLENASAESTSPQAPSTPTSKSSSARNAPQPMARRTAAEEHRDLFGYRPPCASRSSIGHLLQKEEWSQHHLANGYQHPSETPGHTRTR